MLLALFPHYHFFKIIINQLTDIFDALLLQTIHSPLYDLLLRVFQLFDGDVRAGAVGAHAARVGARVALADALVVLRRRHHRDRVAVREGQHLQGSLLWYLESYG